MNDTKSDHVEPLAQTAFDTVPVDVRDALSKVLFPDTLLEEVTLLDKVRHVRAMPLKWSKKIYALLNPVTSKLTQDDPDKEVNVDYTDELVAALCAACSVMAEFYGWDDVVEAIKEEEILVPELQNLVMAQRGVQGTSDFTFQPCSILVAVMQMVEIGVLIFQNSLAGRSF